MDVNSRHSTSNFAHHIVIHWTLFKVLIESFHNNSHQRETIYNKLILFCKIGKAMKVKRVNIIWVTMSTANIYWLLTQNLKSLFKMQTLNAGTSGLLPKRNRLKLFILQLPFCLFNRNILNGHPEYFGIYCSWWNHQIHFEMVTPNKMQNSELIGLSQVCSLHQRWHFSF